MCCANRDTIAYTSTCPDTDTATATNTDAVYEILQTARQTETEKENERIHTDAVLMAVITVKCFVLLLLDYPDLVSKQRESSCIPLPFSEQMIRVWL